MSSCCSSNANNLVFACSGGSNVAQIANDAAKALDQLGQGRMYCGVGVIGRLPGFVETTRKAGRIICIDGCSVACLRQGFEAAGLKPDVHVVVTELGVEKAHHFNFSRDEIALAVGAVLDGLKELAVDSSPGTAPQ